MVLCRKVIMSWLVLASLQGVLHAAPIPDAGSILREQEMQRELPGALPEAVPVLKEADRKVPEEGFVLKGVRFSGYQGLVEEAELQALVAGTVGSRVSFRDLELLVMKVTDYLHVKGWFLSRAYLPKQEVVDGVVSIAILQGRSDAPVHILPDSTVRVCPDVLGCYARSAVRPGEPLKAERLERSVLLMNDLPGVGAKAYMMPGSAPGSSNVDIRVSEGRLVTGSIWADNYGNRYNGTARANLLLSINNPSGYGDRLNVFVTGAEHLGMGRAGYDFPLFHQGLRGRVALSAMRYELGEELSVLDYEGSSTGVEAGFDYPLQRSRTSNVFVGLDYGFQRLLDRQAGIFIRDRRIHTLTLALHGNRYDTVLGGGMSAWSAGMSSGDFQEAILETDMAGTDGNFNRFNLSLSRLQQLVPKLTLNASWNGQFAAGNLDSSQKFYLGGPAGVRAYPVGEAGGDEAHLFNLDMRYALAGSLSLGGFYDAGFVRLNQDRYDGDVSTATNQNEYWLQGAGISLGYTLFSHLRMQGGWAHVIGPNAGRSDTGADADGRADRSRFWLQALYVF